MSPSPPLTDPDVRNSRIRFFTKRFARDGVFVNDLGPRQGMAVEECA